MSPSASSPINLTNQFLIAMPGMVDGNFAGTVVYLCEHNDKGALGLVINRPTELTLACLFDKIELIRGANGLLTGVGNSAGTINYVRKRPTNDAEGSVGVKVGSWGERRVEFDYSTPFTDNGTWAGRMVVAREEVDPADLPRMKVAA